MISAPSDSPCGLARRLAAICYDALVLLAVLFAVTWVVLFLRRGAPVAPGTVWYQLLLAAVSLLFYGWFWTHRGQTLGMRAWRVRVVRADGRALTWRDAASRWSSAWLAALPLGAGFVWGLVDREHLCWHDRLSGTRLRVEGKRRGAG